jgi:catechol O-methyltransferase
MSKFDEGKAYAAQEEDTFFDDGREIELLHFVYNKADIDEIRGSPQRVLAAIDEYARTKKYLMNVGEDKGKIVTDVIREVKPKVMVCGTTREEGRQNDTVAWTIADES